MRHSIIASSFLGAMTAILLISLHGTAEAQDKQLSYAEVMEAYNAAAYEALLPLKDDQDARHKMIAALAPVIKQHLVPYREVLMQEAKRILDELPGYNLEPVDAWEAQMNEDVQESVSEQWRSMFLGNDKLLMMPLFHNPITVAQHTRMAIMARKNSAQDVSKRMMLEAMVPPLVRAIKKETESPVLAFVTGTDVIVVSLKRDEQGIYEPVEFTHLRKKK